MSVVEAVAAPAAASKGGVVSNAPFQHREKVPPLPEGLSWLNVSKPVALSDLRGKFVLLDFWTYCCINCMHVLPELKKLEQAYPDTLVVIGVHSAKFDSERQTDNIRDAILRYRIDHPVINDDRHVVWNRFGVRAWPTLLLIDPEGYAVWGVSGETTFEKLDEVLRGAMPYYRAKGLLRASPAPSEPESRRAKASPLRFPGKILADEPAQRLLIADTNHHRILIARFNGDVIDVIGGGDEGTKDGRFDAASFSLPQGMSLVGETLYIADTGNHMIRKADLKARTVATIAGVGRQSRALPPWRPVRADRTALNSPWDLWHADGVLYVAMAGSHQLWTLRLDAGTIAAFAGNGREDIVDGPLLPASPYQLGASSFAQPSGLTSDGERLYVVDSEGSSIRSVPLTKSGTVRTLVGTSHLPNARLFTFGDVDGPAERARLQHPLAAVFYDGRLFAADTYNHKIKTVDLRTGETTTFVGTGKAGNSDSPAAFREPGGIAAAAGRLFVADTNNHAIRVVDLADRRVTTLTIRAPEASPKSKSPAKP